MTPTASAVRRRRYPKSGLVPISAVRPTPENDILYRPIDPTDPEIALLAKSIKTNGILEPLVISSDGYIVSGHRRYAAAKLAGIESLPCRRLAVARGDDIDAFVVLLREYNRQRDKTRSEKLREELVGIDPEQAFRRLKKDRRAKSLVPVRTVELESERPRAAISKARMPFLTAVQEILEELRSFWPLSDRQIHYQLLNAPPLIHASKPRSRYRNDKPSYKSLTDLLTRARISGEIDMEAIADETRPVITWNVFKESRQFIRRQLDSFCRGYYRDLLQSQANHFELIGEKNTLKSILEPVAADFTIPFTISRGFCSLPPRAEIANRFELSGKDRLVLICVTDFDPEGERIPRALARSLRDDFGIDEVELIKAALTSDHVRDLNLPAQTLAKESSVNYRQIGRAHS